MHPSTKKAKRIVTKGEFIAKTGEKAALSSFGTIVILIGIFCAALTCLGLASSVWNLGWVNVLPTLLGIGLLGVAASVLLYFGTKAVKEGNAIDAGVPLTRANTGDLPAFDSLVRASEEPLQRQESVLLRATLQGPDSPPEQMLRSSIGPQTTERPE